LNPDLEKLFEQAVDMTEAERERFLAQHCSDPDLRRELDLLLAHDQGAETFLEHAVSEEAMSVLEAPVLAPSQRVGPHRILSIIGRGGMGLVYLAERADGKFEQRVAIKVLQSGVDPSLVHDRIQQECRILASLEHPNIARVLDADISKDGLPYFVMEYVEGQPIDRYCELRHLSVRDRLRLLLPICDALHLAHQKLTVHRDLKPDNILVTEQGIPKLLDFGIAKVLGDVPVSPQNTATRVLTPEYASPEQARGEPVTTATDIYSLGGVLYKLLTGSSPHEIQNKSPMGMVRAICDEDIRKPSELRPELAGDLDSILLKAVHTDPQQRYRSIDQFAADLQRWLEGKPVVARPDSVWYRSGKYVRRHLLGVGMATAIVAMLGVGVILQSIDLRRITRERDRANRITDFMTDMFKVPDPGEARGSQVTAREILDKASQDMEKGLAKDPEAQSQMMSIMGQTYENLGLYERAHRLIQGAMDTRRHLLGTNNLLVLQSRNQLGWLTHLEGEDAKAEVLEEEALEAERRTLGSDDPLTLETTDHLGAIELALGRYPQAESLEREVLAVGLRKFGPENELVLRSGANLGAVLLSEARYAEAESQFRQLLEIARRHWGPDHPRTLIVMLDLALVMQDQDRYSEAEPLFRQVLAIQERVLGHDHPLTATAMENLAALLAQEGRLDEDERLCREVLAIRLRTLGANHPDTLVSRLDLADVLLRENHLRDAEKLQRETLSTQLRLLGPENPDTLLSQSDLARTLNREGRCQESEKIARPTFEAQRRTLGPLHQDTLTTMTELGKALACNHHFPEVSKLFHDAIDQQELSKDQGNPYSVWYSFATVAAAANRPDDALQYLREAISLGYKNADALKADDDLKVLRRNPKFLELVAQLKASPGSVQIH
jgi:eukaryotic-like serine/threonine-protein kinase